MCGNLTYIYKDACSLAQAKCLPRLIYREPALEVRFVRGAADTTSFLTKWVSSEFSHDSNRTFLGITAMTPTMCVCNPRAMIWCPLSNIPAG
jgi:hypothetical protein